MLKKIQAALAAFFVLATVLSAPALATNRVQMLHGMNPPSAWFNQYMRNVRLGQGAAWWNNMAGSSTSWPGTYANLSIVPVTGLFVAVGPTNTNTVGTLYQFAQEETTAYGGYPSGTGSDALPADPTKVVLQGTTTANGSNIGPLTAPGTAGQSIDYLIECQVVIQDQTSQSVNVVSTTGTITGTTANRDRSDNITCQSKAGTAATTGSQLPPTVDSGWVSVGFVAVANGVSTITSGMITAGTPFYGFAAASALGTNAVLLSPSAQQTGAINVSGAVAGASFNAGGGSGSITGGSLTIGNTSSFGATISIGTSGASTNAVNFGNSTSTTLLNSNAGLTADGIGCSLWGFANGAGVEQICQNTSGNVGITGALSQVSSLAKKRDITTIDPAWALNQSRHISVIGYCYKNESPYECGAHAVDIVEHMSYGAEKTPSFLAGKKHDRMEPGSLAAFGLAVAKAVDANETNFEKQTNMNLQSLSKRIDSLDGDVKAMRARQTEDEATVLRLRLCLYGTGATTLLALLLAIVAIRRR